MNKTDRGKLKKQIVDLIQQSTTDILEMEKNTQPVKPENSLGRISRMDAINNKGVMEAALRNKRSKLARLKTALSHIDEATFGNCSSCKQEIQIKRLLYMPESDKCVRCAARR